MRFPIVTAILLTAWATGSTAATWSIPDDTATIQAGLDLAAPGDTVLVATGTYFMDDLQITRGVLLRSASGQPEDVILDGQHQSRLLKILAVADTVRIEAITLRNGAATGVDDDARGGAVFIVESPVRFRDCRFDNNTATGAGGAICIDAAPLVELVACKLANNTALAPGIAAPGGAIAMYAHTSEGSLVLDGCVLDGNLSGGPGGAIYVDDGGLYLTDTEVTGSRSGQVSWSAGAGIFARRNHASEQGPEAPNLEVRLTNCRIADNTGRVVAAPYAGDGGGILIKGFDKDNIYEVLVTDTVFEGNFNAQGAGLYMGRYSDGLISRCRFLDNRAYLNGGGAVKGGRWPWCGGETARFEYCEFIGNEAGYDETGQTSPELGMGGGFYTRYYPRAEFINCSFADNRSGGTLHQGDAICHNSEGRTFVNDLHRCLIVNSVFYGVNGLDVQVYASDDGFTSVSYSAWEAGEYVCDGVVPTDIIDLTGSPWFGPTDLRLRETAPFIDQGTAMGISPDLAGTAVPAGSGTDMGAYEWILISGVDQGTAPTAVSRLTAVPNPFNPRTTVSFDLARAGRVQLDFHDLAGRRVRRLLAADLPAGPHSVVWDGRDDSGRGLASAVYFMRLTMPGRTESGRVLLIR